MSGHMTRMSRGSSVGSSASRPSKTSRRTSIWRAGPWQLCTWTERSLGCAAFGLRAAPRWRRCRTAASRAACRVWSRRRGTRRSAGPAAGRAGVREGRGRGWPAAGGRRRGGWCRRGGGSGRGRRRGICHRSSLGCGSHRCRSWWVASASSSSISVLGSRVCPNSDSRSGRSVGDSCSVATVLACRMCGGSASTRSRSARHSGGCH